MPYILKSRRGELEHEPGRDCYCIYTLGSKIKNPGELNYTITKIILNYLKEREHKPAVGTYPNSYEQLNEVVGVLECVKQELYRRVVTNYEDYKKTTNGDVY